MRANKYIYVLTNVMVPSVKERLTGERKFKDSCALSHKAKVVKQWAAEQDNQFLAWPAYLSDLNAIKKLVAKFGYGNRLEKAY